MHADLSHLFAKKPVGIFSLPVAMEFLGLPQSLMDEIHALYSQPHRKYHNVQHVNSMLRWVPSSHGLLKEVLFAVIFHDVVYEPKPVPAGLNEAMSLAHFLDAPHESLGHRGVSSVVEAINATAHHDKDQPLLTLDGAARYVLDLDLQSFSRSRHEFIEDNERVIEELSTTHGLEKTRAGNKAFLARLLERKSLYYVMKEWETPARENLEWRVLG